LQRDGRTDVTMLRRRKDRWCLAKAWHQLPIIGYPRCCLLPVLPQATAGTRCVAGLLARLRGRKRLTCPVGDRRATTCRLKGMPGRRHNRSPGFCYSFLPAICNTPRNLAKVSIMRPGQPMEAS
jgi:hypothetical protein